MVTEPIIESQTDSNRYEAVVRISEAIAACREPEELATTLADEIGKFLHFDHLYFVVLKENSKEIEYLVWGKGPMPIAGPSDGRVALVGGYRQPGRASYSRLGHRRAISAIQRMGEENGSRLGGPRTLDDPASSIGRFRNQPRHSESIQRRTK